MTLEELWQLFPIFLAEHQTCWGKRYLEEEAFLKSLLSYLMEYPDVAKEYEKNRKI
ncbi:hypothetical protein [Clostridium sp.]|uniref:hypothetical protein n=1 Tax=Clostridium sp. TaxID=1506 RepID=UPI002589E5A0|nr:hypothetical protein [Clostridium sp.]